MSNSLFQCWDLLKQDKRILQDLIILYQICFEKVQRTGSMQAECFNFQYSLTQINIVAVICQDM